MWVNEGKTKLPVSTTETETAKVNILEIYEDTT